MRNPITEARCARLRPGCRIDGKAHEWLLGRLHAIMQAARAMIEELETAHDALHVPTHGYVLRGENLSPRMQARNERRAFAVLGREWDAYNAAMTTGKPPKGFHIRTRRSKFDGRTFRELVQAKPARKRKSKGAA